jgi:hypothetical protein
LVSCPSCGTETVQSMVFCHSCGQRVVPEAGGMQATSSPPSGGPAQIPNPHRTRNVAIVAVILVLAVAGLIFVLDGGLSNHTQTVVVASGAAVVPRAFYRYDAFTVPSGAGNPVLSGSFTVNGDFHNQITVLVMSQADFAIWQSGVAVQNYSDSGQVSGASLEVPLSAGQSYVIVFWNTFSTVSATNIFGTITLTFTG